MPRVTDKGLTEAYKSLTEASKSFTEASKEASKGLTNVGVHLGAAGLNMLFNSQISYAVVGILGCFIAYKIVVGTHKGTFSFLHLIDL